MRFLPLAPHRTIYIICGALLMGCALSIVVIVGGISSDNVSLLFDALAIAITMNFANFFLVLALAYLLHTQRSVIEIHEIPRETPARIYRLTFCPSCQRRACTFCGKCHADCSEGVPPCSDAPFACEDAFDCLPTLRGLATLPLFPADGV